MRLRDVGRSGRSLETRGLLSYSAMEIRRGTTHVWVRDVVMLGGDVEVSAHGSRGVVAQRIFLTLVLYSDAGFRS